MNAGNWFLVLIDDPSAQEGLAGQIRAPSHTAHEFASSVWQSGLTPIGLVAFLRGLGHLVTS